LYVIDIPSSTNKKWPWSDEKSEQKALKVFKQTYPAIHDRFKQLEDKLIKRDDQGKFWWELRSCAYYHEFKQPKIIYPNITKTNIFSYDTTGMLTNQKCFIIPTDDLYLLAVLNSKLCTYWFRYTLPLLRGGFFEPSFDLHGENFQSLEHLKITRILLLSMSVRFSPIHKPPMYHVLRPK